MGKVFSLDHNLLQAVDLLPFATRIVIDDQRQ